METIIEKPVSVETAKRKADSPATHGSEVKDAMALVKYGTGRASEWMNVAEPMCAHCIGRENVDQAAGRILAAELNRLHDVIRWALGENGDFAQRPEGKGAYWWRTELRRRANLPNVRVSESGGEKEKI